MTLVSFYGFTCWYRQILHEIDNKSRMDDGAAGCSDSIDRREVHASVLLLRFGGKMGIDGLVVDGEVLRLPRLGFSGRNKLK